MNVAVASAHDEGSGIELASIMSLREKLWDCGYRPVAVLPWNFPNPDAAGKAPLGREWQLRAQQDPPECVRLPAVAHAPNTGIWCGGLRPIDIDVDDVEIAGHVKAIAFAMLGETLIRWRENSGRCLLPYRAADGEPRKRALVGAKGKVEVLGQGQQFVSHGRHKSGVELYWSPEPLEATPREMLPAVSEDQISAFLAEIAPLIEAAAEKKTNGHDHTQGEPIADPLRLAAALNEIANAGAADWEAWNRVGMAVWAATAGSEIGFVAWDAWSARHPSYDAAQTRCRWDHYATSPPTQIGAGTIFHMAAESRRLQMDSPPHSEARDASEPPAWEPDDPGAAITDQPGDRPVEAGIDSILARLAAMGSLEYDRCREGEAQRLGCRVGTLDAEVNRFRRSSTAHNVQDDDAARPPEFTDEALALRFSDRHAHELCYVAAWGRWLIWDGTVWRFDETMKAFDLSRAICRLASAECNDPRVSVPIASAKTVAAVERLAKADRRHAATVDQWDADLWALNTPGGVIDLRSGDMLPHHPDDHMTKIVAVAPGGNCPLWHAFLGRITGGDGELHDFLQRVAGYALTGSTREHALFFAYGTGANGKGTFLNTLTGILGDYATVAPMETFTASHSDRHPADLAMLRGARLVTAQETEEGRTWAESRIKALTGGDPITARFMRQDFFTFTPKFKLFIAGNHKPALRGVDEAMRRRLHLIPFTITIPATERDPELAEKLKAEWPGILAWAIEGCRHWQRIGLKAPAAVSDATEHYLEAEDAMGAWINERCKKVGYGGTESSRLYSDWRKWAVAAGEDPGSQKRFSQAIEAKGYPKDPKARHATFVGIALDDTVPHWSDNQGSNP